MDIKPGNMVLNVLVPCFPGPTVSLSTSSAAASFSGTSHWFSLLDARRLFKDPGHRCKGILVGPSNQQSAQSDIDTLRNQHAYMSSRAGTLPTVPAFSRSAPHLAVSRSLLYAGMLSRGNRSKVKASTLLQGPTLSYRVPGASFGFHLSA